MTMKEKQMISIQKEIEKLQASLERNEAKLIKKTAKAEKLGCKWTLDQWYEYRNARHEAGETVDFDIWEAWSEMNSVEDEIKDLHRRIENAQKRLGKATLEVEGIKANEAESAQISEREKEMIAYFSLTPEERKARYEAWLKAFKAECLKDGVIIDEATSHEVVGTTKSGKKFYMSINQGWTERSLHCYTLTIEGSTIFTSGNFETAYRIVKR